MASGKGKNAIAALVLIGIVVVPVGLILGPEILAAREADRLMEEGERATAVIQSLRDTGNRFNDNPQVEFTLEVTPKTGDPYVAKVLEYVSPVDLMSYPARTQVDVMFDPADRSSVAIVQGTAKVPTR
jgi:hypothetical protein